MHHHRQSKSIVTMNDTQSPVDQIATIPLPEFLANPFSSNEIAESLAELLAPDPENSIAPVIEGSSAMTTFPRGAVIDFRNGADTWPEVAPTEILNITGSCRVFGKQIMGSGIWRNVCIDVTTPGDAVEIEQMRFVPWESDSKRIVECRSGHIVFRGCLFESKHIGVIIGQEEAAYNSITFENCTFRGQREFLRSPTATSPVLVWALWYSRGE